jgi:hypothetical protein
MSGFSPQWLAAREPWDHRARSPEILAILTDRVMRARSGAGHVTRILDLGCGTGSTTRYLTSRLPTALAWTLADGDQGLLDIAAGTTGSKTVTVDLATIDLDTLVGGHDLVTASALLDLVSDAWLDRLWRAMEHCHASLLAGLTYDGRIALAPAHPFDQVIRSLANIHQRSDKGFGPALGPNATAALVLRARKSRWRVTVRRSDWVLDMNADRPGVTMLLQGWASVAKEIAPGLGDRIESWLDDRLSQGTLRVTVGHRDLLASPPD